MQSRNHFILKTTGPQFGAAFLQIAAVILINDALAAAAMLYVYWS